MVGARVEGPGVAYPGRNAADIYCNKTALAATSQVIDLGADYTTIEFRLSAASDVAYIAPQRGSGGVAVNSDFLIPSGGSFTYRGPGIRYIPFLGGGTSGNLHVLAY